MRMSSRLCFISVEMLSRVEDVATTLSLVCHSDSASHRYNEPPCSDITCEDTNNLWAIVGGWRRLARKENDGNNAIN
jgi:hypothetical protein